MSLIGRRRVDQNFTKPSRSVVAHAPRDLGETPRNGDNPLQGAGKPYAGRGAGDQLGTPAHRARRPDRRDGIFTVVRQPPMSKDPRMLRPYPKMASKGKGDTPAAREWVATEKVHGAHFALVCDRTGVRPAKRREVLAEDDLDGFFGVSRIWPTLSVAAARCAKPLRDAAADGTGREDAVVTLYGELAGGRYPHPDVPVAEGTQPVQTGVWYAPGLFWLLFDAQVTLGERRWWVAERDVRAAAVEAGLLSVPVLARGALKQLQDLPAAFASRVPALFGLPELEDNLAEGYVLKPAVAWEEGEARPLLKVKQKAFAEDERFAGARPYIAPPEGAAGVPAWLVVQAAALLTPTRAAAAVSKLGPGTTAEVVVGEIAKDAAEEISEELGGLDPAQMDGLAEALMAGARTLADFDAADRARAARR
ncbi:Rnl2 family RNA ligase [Catenulispora sp. GP43]|uniref:RNA ligase family protein n=1 Tax=Catenulispora sp. GP43 TaxID=3156263 RepID=UPI003518C41D